MKRPYGHNGNPETSPNEHQVFSEFRFYKESGITQIKTKFSEKIRTNFSEFSTWPYEETEKILADIISAE